MLQTVDRIKTLHRMSICGLNTKNTHQYSVTTLLMTCDRIEKHGLVEYLSSDLYERVQRELICNEQFAGYYKKLVDCKVPHHFINDWLESADRFGESLMGRYTVEQMVQMYGSGVNGSCCQYECLKYFEHDLADEALWPALVDNLNAFYAQSAVTLSDLKPQQREMLKLPYFSSFIDVSGRTISTSLSVLSSNETMRAVLDFLFREQVEHCFTEDELTSISHLEAKDLELVRQTYSNLGSDPGWMERFLDWWLSNHGLRHDLQWFAQRREPLTDEEKHQVLDTWVGYLNALYSGSLEVPFASIRPIQYDVLIYAIAHKKKRFLHMVSEHFEDFCKLGRESFLLEESFYTRCNLNALNGKDFLACAGEAGQRNNLDLLEQREYTFQELKLLRYAKPVYIQFYGMLADIGVDRKLIVMRELLKGDLLNMQIADEDLRGLAALLSQKPLSVWRQKELGHIAGLSATDAVRVLLVYDKIKLLIPELLTWEDALFASRNADRMRGYQSWTQMRNDLIYVDQDWVALAKELELDEKFLQDNEQHIVRFIMGEGAEMTRLYYEYTENKEAFRRIILAELMGEFKTLKYYPNDLNREISFPTTKQQQLLWQTNTAMETYGILVEEVDDYYSTLRLGRLPYSTCLSYVDGQYRECLLSSFDSNKKILLAKKNGKVIGRAVIRLTKGRDYLRDDVDAPTLEFADLTKPPEKRYEDERPADQLTLFLERPYFKNANCSETAVIKRMFVSLVRKKAMQMLATPVLAICYEEQCAASDFVRMKYALYISKSKGGAQYLDSLDGQVKVSREGSFKAFPFLVLPSNEMAAIS